MTATLVMNGRKSNIHWKGRLKPFLLARQLTEDQSRANKNTTMNFHDKLVNCGVWRRWISELRWDGMHPIENANKEIFLLKFSSNGGIRLVVTLMMFDC